MPQFSRLVEGYQRLSLPVRGQGLHSLLKCRFRISGGRLRVQTSPDQKPNQHCKN